MIKIKHIVILAALYCLPFAVIYPQKVSRDNYTGYWNSHASWDPEWLSPQSDSINFDITINGYITLTGSLTFSTMATNLTVNDTLVINGDLLLGNRNNIIVNDYGILIIKGNLIINNKTVISSDGYLVVTGDVIKVGSLNQGGFITNDNPPKVFVGGSTPAMLSDLAKYPVLDAIYPYPTIPYVSSGKSFGDMTDLSGDQLFSFLNGTCETKSVSGNGPVCAGDTIHLTASGGDYYRWTGPSGFSGYEQNPSIYGALSSMSGLYSVLVSSKNGCPSATKTIYVTVNDLPVAAAMSPGTVCKGENISLSATGGDTYSWTGPSGFASRLQAPSFLHADLTMTGIYSVDVTDVHGCRTTATTNLIVHPLPVALITGKNSICAGDTIILMAGGGEDFLWSGPTGFISSGTARSIAIMNADVSMTGIYKVIVTDQNGCRADTSTEITVHPVPDVNIEVEKDSICEGDHISVKGTPDGGIFHVRKGPGTLFGSRLNSTGPGVIELEYTVTGICIGSSIRSITVNDKPVAFAGDNQYLNFVFNARMSASLNYGETGKWFSKNSSCKIPDFTSPTAEVTGLSVGENVFTWKVDNGFCTDSSGININVDDLFIPSVITPDNNGKNDFFQINSLNDHTVLMIFDSWGNLEYRNARYKNDWNGKNMKGEQLPADTYFYILDHGDGVIRKGTILIVR